MTADRFASAIAEFDRLNGEDPNLVEDAGRLRARELVQAERLSTWVERVALGPSEALRLAARCQHLRRWEIPRSHYPEGRTGYLAWRKALARFHADTAERVLRSVGYDDRTVEQVRRINLKRGLRLDADVQAMEDALCLAFLEHDFEAFADRHDDGKVIDIVQKTWGKMSERGRQLAAGLSPGPRAAGLLGRALA